MVWLGQIVHVLLTNGLSLFELANSLLPLNQVLLLAEQPAGGEPGFFMQMVNMLLHLDDELKKIVQEYGVWSHAIIFGVIFCETGLVVTPFLPGDSLLFAAGAFAADGSLRIDWLLPLLIVAAIAGDTVNYWMGHWFGDHAFNGKIPFLKKAHLEKTHRFYEKYGGKTIILARFVPIVRTFAPFVAGMGSMNYRLFLIYNVVGGIAWVLIFVPLGYWFGTWPFIKKNFELVMVAIVVLSLLPPIWELVMHWIHQRKERSVQVAEPIAPTEG
jgi:membrane-associated protein